MGWVRYEKKERSPERIMIEGGPDSLEAPSIGLSLDIKEMWGTEVLNLTVVTQHKSGIKLGDGTVSTSRN